MIYFNRAHKTHIHESIYTILKPSSLELQYCCFQLDVDKVFLLTSFEIFFFYVKKNINIC